jgi:DNA-binding NarL/FixJ family response regulator
MTTQHRRDLGGLLLASSSAVLRSRLAAGLEGWLPLAEVADRAALAHVMLARRPALLFVDLALPGLGGLDGVPGVQRLSPSARIILLAAAPSEREAVFALVAGARGYCDRSIAPSLVRKAAEVVQRGEIWIGRHVVPHLLRQITALTPSQAGVASGRSLPSRFDFLAPREREIALLVGGGANNREIAMRLRITESTVKAHLTSVFRKLNVSDRLRLALVVSGHPRRMPRSGRRAPARVPRSATKRPADA